MAQSNSGLGSCVMVVGEPHSALVQTTVRLAREGGCDAVPCDNVYAAVATLAKTAGRRILVVGRIRDLAEESGAFFRIAAARAARCCCLLDRNCPAGHAALLAALGAGITVVGDVQEVPRVFSEWLATATVARSVTDAGDEDLRATEAELRALLGQGEE
ncbi:MAG: hypothetical protein FJ280_12450 [Planctomycetes bacterium]|nr:hypothetical protein [Planctomycetota bacterium]